ncbi:MAG: valine--tRNA ligase [Rickettsiales bacterium]
MNKIPGQYKHRDIEKKWQEIWSDSDVNRWNDEEGRESNFVIDTPPPTVSGLLHMGHIYSYTQTDIVARYQRMSGKNVFYPMGFDDNGLPTERLVEKVKKTRPVDVGRERFRELCFEVIHDAEKEFYNLFNSVALSVDWTQKYQTISDHSRKISQMSFLDLYKKGEVYRALEPNLWDPKDCTALAQADIEDKEVKGFMYDIKFTSKKLKKEFVISTTRPELLPACVAVLYHPSDKRYKSLKNETLNTPLFNCEIPVIADQEVDIDKGSGLVMCCTFGDTQDIQWWKKYSLKLKSIIDRYGKIRTSDVDLGFEIDRDKRTILDELEGNKCEVARDIIAGILEQQKLLVGKKEVIKKVKSAERSGAAIEIQVVPQWLVKILDKKEEIKQKARECEWLPKYMLTRLENWVDGLNWDWCISRQRYFGIPIPIWYSKRKGEEGRILIPEKEQLPVDPVTDLPIGYKRDEVQPELDVLDTWATSSLSPQINSHALNEELSINASRHKKLFPADIRPQAHEIIRTWSFYTIVKSLMHSNQSPWKSLLISGWCLAEDKTKMSKSKGNVVTPKALIETKGADAVRYWSATSKLGADIIYSEKMLDVGKRLLNKIWNATKFSASQIKEISLDAIDINNCSEVIDQWIILRTNQVVAEATNSFKKHNYSDARSAIEEFFWKDFCDNYLEIVKVRAYNSDDQNPKGQLSAQTALYIVTKNILKLFAPVMPFITEELFSIVFPEEGKSIHSRGCWPRQIENSFDAQNVSEAGLFFIEILDMVRKVKAEKNLSMKSSIKDMQVFVRQEQNMHHKDMIVQDLKNVTNSEQISFNRLSDNIALAKGEERYKNNDIELIINFNHE